MKYFITSDTHSFLTPLIKALEGKEFDKDNPEHILIICGDMFDRGSESRELLTFLLELQKQNRLILIKGNHEHLMLDCLEQIKLKDSIGYHHFTNGTIKTIADIINFNKFDILAGVVSYTEIKKKMKPYFKLINNSFNYYEIGNNILVHGWIPHIRDYYTLKEVSDEEWERATWLNGMQEWNNGWRLENKTIICGHWHTSFGNYNYHNRGSGEFENDSCFDPFIDYGIIALDACTAYTGKVNMIVLDERGNLIDTSK